MAVLEVSQDAYSRIRADGHFVVATGHETQEIEDVVWSCNGYLVVDKN
jgi:hypothetical protein